MPVAAATVPAAAAEVDAAVAAAGATESTTEPIVRRGRSSRNRIAGARRARRASRPRADSATGNSMMPATTIAPSRASSGSTAPKPELRGQRRDRRERDQILVVAILGIGLELVVIVERIVDTRLAV